MRKAKEHIKVVLTLDNKTGAVKEITDIDGNLPEVLSDKERKTVKCANVTRLTTVRGCTCWAIIGGKLYKWTC